MDWIQFGATILGVILGSGLIQFLITRKDNKEKDAKKDSANSLRKELKDHLTNVNDKWKIDYCDKNRDAIEKMSEAIEKLTANDTVIAESLKSIADKQDIMASANVGMIHNTLIRFTDPIIARGVVTYDELATLDSLYVPYSKLGGNGECKRRYNDVNKLKIVTPEKAIERDREIETEKFLQMQKVIGA